jgi:hypothetical protein
MHHAQMTESVRRLVSQTFAELGVAPEGELRETILIRDGSYCGRRFENDHATAIWFVEEDQLKVYHADGSVARVLPVTAAAVQLRAAA